MNGGDAAEGERSENVKKKTKRREAFRRKEEKNEMDKILSREARWKEKAD